MKKREEPRKSSTIVFGKSSLKRGGCTTALPSPPKTKRASFDLEELTFPPGVKDIDGNDTDPQLCPDLVVPIYTYLRHLEKEFSIPRHYLKGRSITPKMRCVLIDWLTEVHQRFTLVTETLHLTVSILDRFLSCPTANIKRKQLQLVGVSAMFIASKVEDIYCPEIADFVYITDKSCSGQEIRDMEKSILKTLNFRVNSPLSIFFLRRCSKAGEVTRSQHNLAKYILELSLINYEIIHEAPSLQGAAALFLATKITSEDRECWTPTQKYYSGYDQDDLRSCVKKLAIALCNVESSKFKATYDKFALPSNLRVSLVPELKSVKLKMLAEGCF
ncbi:CCNB2 [Lepeophtheirus salmonis]|nr:CCNB2 [Lepeophtheirus salmonis]CAF3039381.1 CCNB2 [Lepeophtheirus salmonis]